MGKARTWGRDGSCVCRGRCFPPSHSQRAARGNRRSFEPCGEGPMAGGAGVKPAELSNAKQMQCPVDGRMLDSGLPNHVTHKHLALPNCGRIVHHLYADHCDGHLPSVQVPTLAANCGAFAVSSYSGGPTDGPGVGPGAAPICYGGLKSHAPAGIFTIAGFCWKAPPVHNLHRACCVSVTQVARKAPQLTYHAKTPTGNSPYPGRRN